MAQALQNLKKKTKKQKTPEGVMLFGSLIDSLLKKDEIL